MRRLVPATLVGMIPIAACASKDPGPPGQAGPPPPDWVRAQSQGCGMFLFNDPACESALDNGCCVHEMQCASDAGCAKVAQCWNYCENVRQDKLRRNERGACDCFNNCVPQGLATPGWRLFETVASCSKGIGYPPANRCSTGC